MLVGQWTQTVALDGGDDGRLFGTVGVDVEAAQQRMPAFDVRDENLVRIEVAVQATIFALAVVGNGLVLVLLLMISRRKELGRMYTMIGHLSLADLFVAFFNILPQVSLLKSVSICFLHSIRKACCIPNADRK
jgi:hypothetical protein